MKILWLGILSLTSCITLYTPAERVDVETTNVARGSIAIYPIAYTGSYYAEQTQALFDLQKQIGAELKTLGFDEVILLNELNARDIKADHYLKLAFSEGDHGGWASVVFPLTLGIIPLILPFESPHPITAEIQIFDASRNRVGFQTVSREGRQIWHSLLIPIGLVWDHKEHYDAIRNDVVADISDITSTVVTR